MSFTQSSLPHRPTPLKLDRWSVVFFAAVHGVALLAPWFFSWSALGITLFLHWLFGSIGVCLGYHRLLSHRSFQVPRWLEYAIALIGALALQGGPIFWVAGHRLHHAYTSAYLQPKLFQQMRSLNNRLEIALAKVVLCTCDAAFYNGKQ